MPRDASVNKSGVWLLIIGAIVVIPTLFVALVGLSLWLRGSPMSFGAAAASTNPPEFVGRASCVRCHEPESRAWTGSHHDLAMAPATEETVLGDFGDVRFEHRGMHARFYRRDAGYFVQTQNAAGTMQEFEISFTFGVMPLQQYLIGFPDGRYQSLTVAWDARPVELGGQRWFHLQPDEDAPPGDELHWTAPAYNWNHACAECHSTNLRKHYDAASDTFATTWTDIDVSCESCHGPGGRHVALATAREANPNAPYPTDGGLIVDPGGPGDWQLIEGAATAGLASVSTRDGQVEMCARCHSRRMQIAEHEDGHPLLDTHWPSLLDQGLYFPDGQILDEVYVYGSFLQSRMYALGVTCSDCHDPHSLRLRESGNALCARCHAAVTYDAQRHHFHEPGTSGAACVECHMPSRTYMVVDPRRDHSMRIPRPDLSVTLGLPNACNQCHTDKPAQWAADAIVEWYGEHHKLGTQTYAMALDHARAGAPGASGELAALAADQTMPVIARATALKSLAGFLGPSSVSHVVTSLDDEHPLIRRAAAEALEPADAATRWRVLSERLGDPVRAVRLAAASNLLDVRPEDVDATQRELLASALGEFEAVQMLNAERAESWVNLARLHAGQGEIQRAERDFAEARRRNRRYIPTYINQADLYRALGREADAHRVLSDGLQVEPDSAALRHSVGLLYIRTGRTGEAMSQLAAAHRLAPDNARFGYVYGVALQSTGAVVEALEVWRAVLEIHPFDRDVLAAITTTLRDRGEFAGALAFARRLAEIVPGDPEVRRLVEAIEQASPGE